MRSRPILTVVILLALLAVLVAAVYGPAMSVIRNLQMLLDSTASPSVPCSSDPTTLPTKPATKLPTAPATQPEPPVTQPTVPATEPTLPATQPPTEPAVPPTVPTEPLPCAHTYEAEVVAATCVEPGYTNYVCSLCGDSYADDFTELGDHSYSDWQIKTEPTCTQEGEEVCTCAYCGDQQLRTLEALDHSYGSWKITQDATCTADGRKERECKRCGDVQSRSVDATGHDYDGGVTVKEAASCADRGIKRYTCKTCGDSYETSVAGDHHLFCDTCAQYATGSYDGLHEPGCQSDFEHLVACQYCDFGYMDKAYYLLCQGVITEDSALFTDTVKLKNPEYNGVLGTWPQRWHDFATFTQMGIMYGSWSKKDGWEGSDYEFRVWEITSYEEAEAVLEDYNRFVVEFEKVYYWKPVEVKMEYVEEYQYVRLYYYDQDQYNTYRKQKKNVTDEQKQALAEEMIGYTLQKWGIRDGMPVASILEYLYYMIWSDVAYYDQSLRFHSAYDGFATHTCVCDGYSEMFQLYADALGINSKEMFGSMYGAGHAWNRITFSDGTKWHIDITNGPVLKTDEEMREIGYKW